MNSAAGSADLKLALWAVNHAYAVSGREAWLDLLSRQMASAAEQHCELLALPEYVSAHWLHWAAGPFSGHALMHWMADEGAAILPGCEALVRRHGIGLVAGSAPWRIGSEGVFNRSWVLLPQSDGSVRRIHHDKLVPTPSEREQGDWPIVCGTSQTLIEWRGRRLAILICLDVEMPSVIAGLQAEAIDLLIVPSMTGQLSGYHRVFDCAKAVAVQLFGAVAVVGGVGALAWGMGANCAGAAVYLPCEEALGSNGCLASIGPMSQADGPGPLLVADIPIGRIRALKRAGPEAWPGPFPASNVVPGRLEVVP